MIDEEPSKKGKREYRKHGFVTMKRAVKELGLRVLDGRTTRARELKAECAALISALGGPKEVTPQELIIIEKIAHKELRWKPAALWALEHPEQMVNRRKKTTAPLEKDLDRQENSIIAALDKLGLKRRAKQVLTLAQYLNGKPAPATNTNDTPPKGATPPTSGGETNDGATEGDA